MAPTTNPGDAPRERPPTDEPAGQSRPPTVSVQVPGFSVSGGVGTSEWVVKLGSVLGVLLVAVALTVVIVGPRNRWWGIRPEWGPFSGYLAAALTLAAVVVALRSNRRAIKLSTQALAVSRESAKLSERAIEDAEARARLDRVYAHRRETVKAVRDMWSEVRFYRSEVIQFVPTRLNAQNEGARTSPTETATEILQQARTRIVEAAGDVRSATNYAAILADEGAILDHVVTVRADVDALLSLVEEHISFGAQATGTLHQWASRVRTVAVQLGELDDGHVSLLRRELPLHDQAQQQMRERRERDARREANNRAYADSGHDVTKANTLYPGFLAEERAKRNLTGPPPGDSDESVAS